MLPHGLFQPELSEINRLPARTPLIPHADAASAQNGDPTPWRRSLDGDWRFKLVDRPTAAPAKWHLPGTDDSRWRSITVPGCWTRQDTGDLPHYTNVIMPWPELEPGEMPDHNPTGLYRTTFRVPRDWRRRQVVLHVGGAESVAVVWCNGTFVGMGKDSRLPSEFDLSPHLVQGTNLLAVMVIRWSDATWIEDQDHWWHAGLHRSCHLEARGVDRIDDLTLLADYDPDSGRGTLVSSALVAGDAAEVRTTLLTDRGRRIGSPVTDPVAVFDAASPGRQSVSAYVYVGSQADSAMTDLKIEPWSAESPTRYRVVTELLDDGGGVIEAHSTWVGFRRVEIRDRRLLINGTPIVLHGVNRHDHHPDTGKTVTAAEIRDELVLMKQHNINAVRTAHYPNDHVLLDLCDELGLYVIDEANVESHARLQSLTKDQRWFDAVVQRTRRMVARDRNHPCIIGWSLGNESGHGPCHDAAAAWVRHVDPSRFVHYEGALDHRLGGAAGPDRVCIPPSASERATTDVVAPMYAPIDTIVRWARWAEETELDDRPLFLCEFSHAMGNSNGSLDEYVDAFHAEPALAGGFVWDWRDQGLAEVAANGRPYWAFGGHFGDEPNDANFCINGLVGPDLTPHPSLREYQWACRPVVTTHVRGGQIRVANRRHFTDTGDVRGHWTVRHDGVAVDRGVLDLVVAPGSSATIRVDSGALRARGTTVHLDVEWRSRRSSAWSDRGHVVSWDQLTVTSAPARMPSGSRPEVIVDDAGIQRVEHRGRTLVLGDITGCLWRAPTDNDGIKQGWQADRNGVRQRWLAWGLDDLESVVDDVAHRRRSGLDIIELRRRLVGTEAHAAHVTRITIDEDHLRFDERIELPAAWDDVPRVGVRFEAPVDLDRLSWLGLGPDESYPDRQGAQIRARWDQTVAEQYHDYVVPQEHGAHTGTAWFALRDAKGTGLAVTGVGDDVSFSARHHHDQALTRALTLADLDAADTVEVHVDTAMRGLGTAICGPDTLPPYLVRPGVHRWSWTLAAAGRRSLPT